MRGRLKSAVFVGRELPSMKSSILSTLLKSSTNPATRTTPETRWPAVGSSMTPIGCAPAATHTNRPATARSARCLGAVFISQTSRKSKKRMVKFRLKVKCSKIFASFF